MTLNFSPLRRVMAAVLAVAALAVAALGSGLRAADTPGVTKALTAIQAVSREGAGNDAAAAAWKTLTTSGIGALVPTLTAFDTASPTAANWLRSAIDAITEVEAKAGRKLPADALLAFIQDVKRNPAARRIAFELLTGQDKPAAEALLPGMLNDPSLELRRDAIAAEIAKLKLPANAAASAAGYEKLFVVARDKDQVEELAELIGKTGKKPDLTRHFGYITEWNVVGPFDSTDRTGFSKPYAPEAGVDLAAKYDGKGGPVTWKPSQSSDVYGNIDLNKDLGKTMDAASYAHAVIVTEKETPADIRLASKNAIQVFLNGSKIYEKDEYHHGKRHDQHVAKVTLKPGKNEILVKVCQNNQTDSWAQEWDFALRVCDFTGAALPIKQQLTRNGVTETIVPGIIKPAPKKEDK